MSKPTGNPRGRPRAQKPEAAGFEAMMDRAAYVEELRAELNRTTSEVARSSIYALIGRAAGHFIVKEEETTAELNVPEDELEAARFRLSDVQRRLTNATGIAFTRLLDAERRLKEQIRALTPPEASGHSEDMAALVAEVRDMPDAAVLVVVEEAKRRGLV
jgi:hypothetical protein